jgi:hypothetical protein
MHTAAPAGINKQQHQHQQQPQHFRTVQVV